MNISPAGTNIIKICILPGGIGHDCISSGFHSAEGVAPPGVRDGLIKGFLAYAVDRVRTHQECDPLIGLIPPFYKTCDRTGGGGGG